MHSGIFKIKTKRNAISLAVFFILFIIIIFFLYFQKSTPRPQVSDSDVENKKDMEEYTLEYRNQVTAILDEYEKEKNADGAYNKLLEITVPRDAKDVHLNLIFLLDRLRKAEADNIFGLEEDLKRLKEEKLK